MSNGGKRSTKNVRPPVTHTKKNCQVKHCKTCKAKAIKSNKNGAGAISAARIAPTQNAFKVGFDSGNWGNADKNYGFSVHTQDAFETRANIKRRLGRGLNPSVKAWLGGQSVNEFGQFNPKKDTIEPFNEFVALVPGVTSPFEIVQQYQLNPGLAGTFPQLSEIAKLYERYMFLSLEFYLAPIVTVFGSSGKLIMSCDLEGVEEPPPNTAAQMENNTIHVDGMPHEKLGFQVAGVIRHRESWFVRTTAAFPPGADPRGYDAGTLYVGAYGNPNTSDMAELRVRGRVMLMDKLTEPTGLARAVSLYSRRVTGGGSAQAVASSVLSTVHFDVLKCEDCPWIYDGSGLFTCPLTAYYQISGSIQVGNPAGSVSAIAVEVFSATSGTLDLCLETKTASTYGTQPFNASVALTAGEVISVRATITFASGTTSIEHAQLTIVTL